MGAFQELTKFNFSKDSSCKLKVIPHFESLTILQWWGHHSQEICPKFYSVSSATYCLNKKKQSLLTWIWLFKNYDIN